MKYLQTGSLILLCCFCYLTSFAQKIPINEPDYNKPKLFTDLPVRITLNSEALQPLLSAGVSETVTMRLTNDIVFTGQVISSVSKYDDAIHSVLIKWNSRAGANLSLSRIINTDGSVSYRGRIMSMQHGDGFELAMENGQFYLVKKEFYDMVNE